MVHLELGGKNPVILMEDADLPLALDGVLFGAFGTAGQRCTATSRLIVHAKVYDQFLRMLTDRLDHFTVGDPLDPKTGMGPVASADQERKILEYIEVGKKEAKLRYGGHKLTGGVYDRGFFLEPTIFETKHGTRISKEEIFGPVLSVIRVNDYEEAVRVAQRCRLRALLVDLHAGRQPRLPGDPRSRGRDHVHQRPYDRRRGPAPVRRGQEHRERGSGGGQRRDRGVHRDQDGLHRLLGEAPKGPDRYRVGDMSPYRATDEQLDREITALERIGRVRVRRASAELKDIDKDLRELRKERARRAARASEMISSESSVSVEASPSEP